uniref:Putative secreted protein ovary overexpressed n=1 Tax=Rhipicephalus microplus TaxID=6941 RepID=A0A6M2DCL5_RHIMP
MKAIFLILVGAVLVAGVMIFMDFLEYIIAERFKRIEVVTPLLYKTRTSHDMEVMKFRSSVSQYNLVRKSDKTGVRK